METVDYKLLLEKYMKHVDECEGTTFVKSTISSIKFTDIELETLIKIDNEIWKQ